VGLSFDRFVHFIENHDTAGNRVLGQRFHHLLHRHAYEAAVGLYLFWPGIPLLFMGEELGASTPFRFFTDHLAALGENIRNGRIQQHGAYQDWSVPGVRERIPDPQAEETFIASRIPWSELGQNHAIWACYRRLLALRAQFMPWVDRTREGITVVREEKVYGIVLRDRQGCELVACLVNFAPAQRPYPGGIDWQPWKLLWASRPLPEDTIPGYSAFWFFRQGHAVADSLSEPDR
jgi:1,4-alpha-glucan branching enzyme